MNVRFPPQVASLECEINNAATPLLGKDENHRSTRSLSMSDEVTHLRSQARRCRRLAENVSSDKDQAMLTRGAKDFDQAADELEKKKS
jgi:hypothetical protein